MLLPLHLNLDGSVQTIVPDLIPSEEDFGGLVFSTGNDGVLPRVFVFPPRPQKLTWPSITTEESFGSFALQQDRFLTPPFLQSSENFASLEFVKRNIPAQFLSFASIDSVAEVYSNLKIDDRLRVLRPLEVLVPLDPLKRT